VDVVVTVVEYKNQLKALGYAASTIEGYRKGLDQFIHYLKARGMTDLRKVTHQVILDYQVTVMNEAIAMESKALKIRPIKRLFDYLVSTHKLLVNPTEGIVETTRRNRKIGPVLSIKEVENLLAQPNLSLKTHIRDRAIMEVLYSTGIRLDELLSLEVYHIDLNDKVISIRKGKGKTQRVVPLGKNAMHYLKEYLDNIRPYYARKNPHGRRFFLTHSGQPMTPDAVRGLLTKYRKSAGIRKPVSPHVFRRTCATHLLQQGADIRYIQELLGHKHLSTTQTYTKVMPVEVKTTHDRTHPVVEVE
jgi:integrase/recombinase XerD